MNRFLWIFLAVSSLGFIGCTGSKKAKDNRVKHVQMGDPAVLYADTKRDTDFSKLSFLKNGATVYLTGVVNFSSVESYGGMVDIEKENAASKNPEEDKSEILAFKVSRHDDSSLTFSGESLTFTLLKAEGGW